MNGGTEMDVREKLVELLLQEDGVCEPSDCKYCGVKGSCGYYRTADRLIANGVTVQEWISADDRLPEEKGRYLTANKRCGDKIVVFDLWFGGGFWYVEEEDDVFDFEVTHWMPMPNPPKGE